MKCYLPKNSSFCEGVHNAIEIAYRNANNTTYMFGEIVHNPIVIEDLLNKGIHLAKTLDDIPDTPKSKVLIRAHGITPEIYRKLQAKKVEVIDKTCPRVKKVHELVKNASDRGLDIVLIGNPNHPEVIGTVGWINTKVFVIKDIADAMRIVPQASFSQSGICMVAQTTYNKEKYEEIYRYFLQFDIHIEYNNTICNATAERQNEIRLLSKEVDGFIIIGGKASSNVSKLYKIASEVCSNTQLIENADEMDFSKIATLDKVVIASGASTPQRTINEVIEKIEKICEELKIDFILRRL